ncbi:exodeoxyribonuclease VII small subunit [Adhaeribacter aquaticus]|uniref:exodeoxyribonuclease VII small subunit n=1 Tax=Adhaeribacter aquaticus TaxID=299567 RepID=UPI000419E0E5|nr:exodeoxyribonuclease VII small subunit [Adhaeribacter aquaticus]
MITNLTYQEALDELTDIISRLESESIPIDELAQKVKRASELIQYCQSKLTSTDSEVKKIISQLEDKSDL